MLTLEAFCSKLPITPLYFYIYDINMDDQNYLTPERIYALLEKVKATNFSGQKLSLIVEGGCLFSNAEIKHIPFLPGLQLVFRGEGWLDIQKYQGVYTKVILESIQEQLELLEQGYIKKGNYSVVKACIMKAEDLIDAHKLGVCLYREYKMKVAINSENKVLLYCNFKGIFKSIQNIFECQCKGEAVEGQLVQYDWVNFGGVGKITKILKETISECCCLEDTKAPICLLDYYKERNQGYRFNEFTEKDFKAHIVEVKLGNKQFKFIPHALTPIITREVLAQRAPEFSKQMDHYIKLNMASRHKILQSLIRDIGVIDSLNGLSFTPSFTSELESFGFYSGELNLPLLRGAKEGRMNRNPLYEKTRIFSEGFYCQGKYEICPTIYYPNRLSKQLLKQLPLFKEILYKFAKLGTYTGSGHVSLAHDLLEKLHPIEKWKEIGYSDVMEISQIETLDKEQDFAIVILDTQGIDENQHYEQFKEIFAQKQIASQMITIPTFQQICKQMGLYEMKNIILGMLVKTGGIPWIPEKMPGDVDCFVGLDVGMLEPGKHQPTCSILFNKVGQLVAYYKPKCEQQGEKIEEDTLEELFNKILNTYQRGYNSLPHHIMIHRDGFSNENIEWYKNYFDQRQIKFDIVEIKKNVGVKLAEITGLGSVMNPSKGSYIMNDKTAYLVTTDIKDTTKQGSPCPIKIQKTYGELPLATILEQVFILAEMHVGAFKNTRLPITTAYADRMCQFKGRLGEAPLSNRLYFL